MDDGMLAILLDIKEQQGVMGAQLMEAARSRARMEDSIKEIKREVSEIKPVVKIVSKMEPEHDELVKLRDKGAAILIVASVVVAAAFALIVAGVKYFGTAILALFTRGG